MDPLIQGINRYSSGLFLAIEKYCAFANKQARNEADLLFLGLGPIGLITLLLVLLPKWFGIALGLIVIAPAIANIERVRRALQGGLLTRQALIERAALSQTQTLCAVDSLIASGEVAYLADARQFSARQPA